MQNCLLRSINCWEKLWVRVFVYSIQVDSIYVLAPISTTHTVWIENRDNFEHKVAEQQLALLIRGHQKVKNALKEEGGNSLTAVYPRRDENCLSVEVTGKLLS